MLLFNEDSFSFARRNQLWLYNNMYACNLTDLYIFKRGNVVNVMFCVKNVINNC